MIEIRDITQQVYNILKREVERENVFPIVAPEGTNLPFAVFERSTLYDTETKDGNGIEVGFTIRIVTATYFEGLRLVDHIRYAMRHSELKPRLTGATEEYTTDGYVQTLSFTF